ncbi:MAG: ABC transporter ATP-binding protein [Clostridiaceae bacterium]|nr:ABC transporter ATP-binding protein [Clostridiaceae bacterium]
MKILECRELVKKYGGTEAVAGLSFSVEKGEVLGLLGPNGAGKTTTIKMILGLTRPTGGDVTIDRETRIGYSPETPYFHPFLTGCEVLRFYSRLQRLDKEKAEPQIRRLLELTGLSDAEDKRIKNYSKGMLQRLAFGQALLGDPDLLILDEPTSGLDAVGRIEMLQLVSELKSKGKTIIFNSHILSDVEKIADRTIFITNGRLAGQVSRSELCGTSLEELFVKTVGGAGHACSDAQYIQ